MSFQLNAKNIFLTYAQCTITKEALSTFLVIKFPDASIRVGHEFHEDGGDHLHAFIMSPVAIRTRNPRYFDIDGFHPKVEGARKPKASYDYCGKDGDIIDVGEFSFKSEKRQWSEVFAATTPAEAMEAIKEISPRDYILSHERVEYFVRKQFEKTLPEYEPEHDSFITDIFPELNTWLDQINEVT